jgi:type IV pilus assembly protein PilM
MVRAVELRKRRLGWTLLAAGETSIGDDSIALSEAIQQLLETMRLGRARVTAALAGESVFVHRVRLPAMGRSALAEAVAWEAEQCVPFDLAHARLDYHVLNPEAPPASRARDVLLVAARKACIESRTAAIRQAGHQPTTVDVEAFALANAYQMNYPEHAETPTAVLNVGRSTALVCLLERGQLMFTRDIALPVPRDEAAGTRRDSHAQLVAELRTTVDSCCAGGGASEIKRVVLAGGHCRSGGLIELLQTEFSVPVDLFEPFRKVRLPRRARNRGPLGPAYAVAVGLAMRRERDR